jgi:hypothetical protein
MDRLWPSPFGLRSLRSVPISYAIGLFYSLRGWYAFGDSQARSVIMRQKMLATAVLISVLTFGGSVARAGNITYMIVNNGPDQNGYTLSGTIVTKGTLGALTADDFVSWQFTITGPGGPFNGNDTAPTLPGAWSATATQLTVNNPTHLDSGSLSIVWSPGVPAYSASDGDITLWNTAGRGYGASPWVVAVAAPEPSTMVLAGLAAVCGAAIGLARNRRAHRADQEGVFRREAQ